MQKNLKRWGAKMPETFTKDLAKAFEILGQTNKLIERLGKVVLTQNEMILEMRKEITKLNLINKRSKKCLN